VGNPFWGFFSKLSHFRNLVGNVNKMILIAQLNGFRLILLIRELGEILHLFLDSLYLNYNLI